GGIVFAGSDDFDVCAALRDHPIDQPLLALDEPGASAKKIAARGRQTVLIRAGQRMAGHEVLAADLAEWGHHAADTGSAAGCALRSLIATSTGVARIVKSASPNASAFSSAAFARRAASSVTFGSMKAMRQPRARRAMPIEPPINPSPAMSARGAGCIREPSG